MSEPKKVGITHHVLGDEWLLGKENQERERNAMRRAFDKFLATEGVSLIGEATETTEYDEERGEVILRRWGYAK